MRFGVITFGNQVFQTPDLLIRFQEFSPNLLNRMAGITANPARGPADEG